MARFNALTFTIYVCVVLATAAGCTSLKLQKPDMWPFNTKDQPGSPSRIVATWTDTVLYQSNQTPMRGFGGRLLFYADEKDEPIKVNGTLTVYVFDGTNRDSNNDRPDRKYVFAKEQLQSHYSKSKFGHSYSVWIPWDEAGGEQKEMSLIARFAPAKGSVLVGEQVKQILPGKTPVVAGNVKNAVFPSSVLPAVPAQYPSTSSGPIQAASYVTPLPPTDSLNQSYGSGEGNLSRRMNTTTIRLPPQSSLKNLSAMGQEPNFAMSNGGAVYASTGVNSAVAVGEQAGANAVERPAGAYPDTGAVNAGISSLNREYRPYLQPGRFGSVRPRVPGEPIVQPYCDRGPSQPRPSVSAYRPETTPSQAIDSGAQPCSANAGLMPN